MAREELRRLRGRLGPGAAAARRHAAMPALHRLPTIHRAEGANRPPPPDPTLARSRARAIYPTSRGASMTPAPISSDPSGGRATQSERRTAGVADRLPHPAE